MYGSVRGASGKRRPYRDRLATMARMRTYASDVSRLWEAASQTRLSGLSEQKAQHHRYPFSTGLLAHVYFFGCKLLKLHGRFLRLVTT
jgi:hypothetical protein